MSNGLYDVGLYDEAQYDVNIMEGSGSGDWNFTGVATGKTTRRGTGAGTWNFAGVATGTTIRTGSSVGTWNFAGIAVGTTTRNGSASGLWEWNGEAVGRYPRTSPWFTVEDGLLVRIEPIGRVVNGSLELASNIFISEES